MFNQRYSARSRQMLTLDRCVSLCNLIMICSLIIACEPEVPLPLQVDLSAPVVEEPDAEPMPEVPLAGPQIFEDLPAPPKEIVRKPGQSAAGLQLQRPNLKEVYSPRTLVEHLDEGPFRTIVYLLDKGLNRVESIRATFDKAYMHEKQYMRLQEYITARLGKPRKIRARRKKGLSWKNTEYRIELYIDKRAKDLVLLFHERGAEDLKRFTKKYVRE